MAFDRSVNVKDENGEEDGLTKRRTNSYTAGVKPKLVLAAAVAFVLASAQAQFPTIATQFVNATQGERPDSDIWINFSGGGAATLNAATGVVTYNATASIGTANIWNGSAFVSTPIYSFAAYQLSDIQNGTVNISTFGGGRAYVSYGSALTNIGNSTYSVQNGPYAGWQPAPASPDVNLAKRFQAFELTIQPTVAGTSGNFTFSGTNQAYANLSYIDQVSISTGINVLNAPTGTSNPTQASQNTKALIDAVAVYNSGAAGNSTYTAETNVITIATETQYYQVAGNSTTPGQPYSNPGSTSIANPAPDLTNLSNIARVTGPGSMPTAGSPTGDTTVYPTWTNYLNALVSGGSLNASGNLTTQLAGAFGATGQPAQAYTGNATFQAGVINLGGTDYTGYVEITSIELGGVAQTEIYVPFSSLTASTGLYGTNPSYAIGNSTLTLVPGNTFATRIVGDVVAGMSFGTLGSTVSVTYNATTNTLGGNGTTQALGLFTSEDWWSIGALDGMLLFSGAQPDNEFYNTYAADLQFVTAGYGFGIQDRLGQNTTQFNRTTGDGFDNAVLQFLIQPDTAAIPEPQTLALLAGTAGLLFLMRRRRAKSH